MKDQYFGDFGDYQKISLLKILKNKGLHIVTYWMKTKDDTTTDGKHITYLQKPDLWRSYQPDIFDFIRKKISSGKRLLSHIEEGDHCQGIRFISDYIEDIKVREKILENICADKTSDIVFFDPDNGIEVVSTTRKNMHKYVLWDELIQTFNSGKSLLIYQHFSRSNREVFIQNKIDELRQKINTPILPLRAKHSVYFFVPQKRHELLLKEAVKDFSEVWS
jgi:hypothetical protein